jgi:hypothetical protein
MLGFDLYAIWPKMQSAEIEKLTTLIDFYGESEKVFFNTIAKLWTSIKAWTTSTLG